MAFVKSIGIGTGTAIAYEAVDTLAQYSNSKKQMLSFVTNGELVMIGAGAAMLGVAYWAWRNGKDMVAAVGVELGPLLLVAGVLDVIKRKMSGNVPALAQVAQVRQVPVRPAPAPVPVATGSLFTAMD
ncbi:MAG: hypothetical protein RXP77_03110 [Nitrososphaeria archaeon]